MNIKISKKVNGVVPETGGNFQNGFLKNLVSKLIKNQAQLYLNTNFDLLLEMDNIRVSVGEIVSEYNQQENSVHFKTDVEIDVSWNLKEAIKETLEVALDDTPFLVLEKE